jgi:hypothetical protein
MGLDLVVEGCAKPGHEAEWRRLLERSFRDEPMSEAETARFAAISIPGYERLGAPRVGFDPEADRWLLSTRNPPLTAGEAAAMLRDFHGYHAVRLVKSDGVPRYSNAGGYEGIDETSFRGSFLEDCTDVLDKATLTEAWSHKMPEAALAYGKALLAAADSAEARGVAVPRTGIFGKFGLGKKSDAKVPFNDQLDIVRSAGRWYVFWGERGHAVRAWF